MKCALTLLKPECTRRWPNFRFRSRLQERPHPLSLCFPAMVVELMNNLVSYKTSVKNKVLTMQIFTHKTVVFKVAKRYF